MGNAGYLPFGSAAACERGAKGASAGKLIVGRLPVATGFAGGVLPDVVGEFADIAVDVFEVLYNLVERVDSVFFLPFAFRFVYYVLYEPHGQIQQCEDYHGTYHPFDKYFEQG